MLCKRRSHLGYKPPKDNTRKQQSTHHSSEKLQNHLLQHPLRNLHFLPEHTLQSKATTLPNTETQSAPQNSPASVERKSPVTTDRAMDIIRQLLEKLNSRMELHEASGTQIIIGGDFNAKHGIWEYAATDSRGRILADELESLPLHICNTVGAHTRAGLHAKQADTTPDLTIATPKIVKRWEPHPTTWGSDHYPIIFTINKKISKQRELIRTINWSHFREGVGDEFECIEEFAQLMRDNLSSATEETLGEEDEGVIDSRMIAFFQRANKLTQKYKTNGRKHQTLRRIRDIFELIRQHGEDLSRAQWVSTCERQGKINGMKQLWGILRKMLGKGRGEFPLETLTLRHGTDKYEERIIKTFFPHASTTPPAPLATPKLDSTNPDQDTPFTLGELHAAIKQVESTRGHRKDDIQPKIEDICVSDGRGNRGSASIIHPRGTARRQRKADEEVEEPFLDKTRCCAEDNVRKDSNAPARPPAFGAEDKKAYKKVYGEQQRQQQRGQIPTGHSAFISGVPYVDVRPEARD
ncbi:hypothetical protein HPB49_024170 [Dermacentor silvarum]|uniref:Uncharacterized protein n=1 Tax=Dermacentor silvarum TaxID=543639 RepID=A0ACB8DLH4_DERSI|nr:hypothetical protein HPB49_024170 [Dermacentor silvarum]